MVLFLPICINFNLNNAGGTMKKGIVLLMMIVMTTGLYGQVFNNAQVMDPGEISVSGGLALGGNSALFALGKYGFKENLDLGARIALGNDVYAGVLAEYLFHQKKYTWSVSGGAHFSSGIGLDLTLTASKPLNEKFDLYGGFDWDLFSGGRFIGSRLFVGTEIAFRDNLNLMAELNLGTGSNLAGGVMYYF